MTTDARLHLPRPLRAALAAAALLATMAIAAHGAERPPNLVIVLMDDMGYGDVSVFNPQTRNRTPNAERMAREGMRLTSFYASPVCTPSRAQLLTGCYAKRVSLPRIIPPVSDVGIADGEHTIAELLSARGYATMCIGKWHVGDQPGFLPIHRGFDHYFGIPYSNDMGGHWDGIGPHKGKGAPPLPLLRDERVVEVVTPAGQDEITERYTDAAIGFLRANRDHPFFLYLAHNAVHVPIHPGKDFLGKSGNGRYGDWVEEGDACLGRVLDAVREIDPDHRTLVVFTSDNGPWLVKGTDGGDPRPLRGGKGSTFEGGMREPTIAWWPGRIAADSRSDAVVGLIDLLPTFVALAGGTTPTDHRIDGVDISPVLFGRTDVTPHEAYYYFERENLQAVRSGRWKLALVDQEALQNFPPKRIPPAPDFHPRLYDLETDVGETTDVAQAHPDIVRRLQQYADAMAGDLGDAGPGPGVRPPGRVEHPAPLLLK